MICPECDDIFVSITELEYRQLAIWWYSYTRGYSTRMDDVVKRIAAKYEWDDETLKKVARKCYEVMTSYGKKKGKDTV